MPFPEEGRIDHREGLSKKGLWAAPMPLIRREIQGEKRGRRQIANLVALWAGFLVQ
jgi:hypothetical protein